MGLPGTHLVLQHPTGPHNPSILSGTGASCPWRNEVKRLLHSQRLTPWVHFKSMAQVFSRLKWIKSSSALVTKPDPTINFKAMRPVQKISTSTIIPFYSWTSFAKGRANSLKSCMCNFVLWNRQDFLTTCRLTSLATLLPKEEPSTSPATSPPSSASPPYERPPLPSSSKVCPLVETPGGKFSHNESIGPSHS